MSRYMTLCYCPVCLDYCSIDGAVAQQAWREKVTLCMLIGVIMALVGYFSLGLKAALCPDNDPSQLTTMALNQSDPRVRPFRSGVVVAFGSTYALAAMASLLSAHNTGISLSPEFAGADISRLFVMEGDPCRPFIASASPPLSPSLLCSVPNPVAGLPALAPALGSPCPSASWLQEIAPTARLSFSWTDISQNSAPPHTLVVFSSVVLNLTDLFNSDLASLFASGATFPQDALDALNTLRGSDITLPLAHSYDDLALAACLKQRYTAGFIGSQSLGCGAYNVIMSVSLAVVLGLIFVRFLMALVFHWVVSPQLTSSLHKFGRRDVGFLKQDSRPSLYLRETTAGNSSSSSATILPIPPGSIHRHSLSQSEPLDPYTLLLVTCYSEDEHSIRGTLDSLASTDYPTSRKLLFVIADGLVTGDGNTRTTPDYIISMITQEPSLPPPVPQSYLAIALGTKQHNRASVYAGWYTPTPSYGHSHSGPTYRVPILVIVKCGNQQETQTVPPNKKAGNRGKRDSQLILLNFLSRVHCNDRLTPLDYDLFVKMERLMSLCCASDAGSRHPLDSAPTEKIRVLPTDFEILLMVDADTFVARDSLRAMVQAMKNDERVMGLCGETRIANKRASWVTMIQVELHLLPSPFFAFESC
eukprot:jgi/Hompol1/3055/HPOL_000022-RA